MAIRGFVGVSLRAACVLCVSLVLASTASAQIGRRFPSEKRVVPDPVTGIPLTFISQGGSAMLAALGSAGILLSVSRRAAKR